MYCNRCGAEAQANQKFCAECGASLAGITDVTEELEVQSSRGVRWQQQQQQQQQERQRAAARLYDFASDEPDDITGGTERDPALLATVPDETARSDADTQPISTDSIKGPRIEARYGNPNDPWAEGYEVTPTGAAAQVTGEQTGVLVRTGELTAEMPAADASASGSQRRFGLGVVAGVSLIAAVVGTVGVFANTVSVGSDNDSVTFETGDWSVGELGANLPVAGLAATGCLLIGAIASGFRFRWGAGLAGGAGLALAGWVALTLGLAEQPIQAAMIALDRPVTEPFSVTFTRDLGYWLLAASALLGVVVFVVALGKAGRDQLHNLNPWIAALGALAAVIAAAGPLLPVGAAELERNWTSAGGDFDQPTLYLAGRLIQLALLAFTGVLGFLLVRRWGLGLMVGGILPSVWLAASTLFGLVDRAVGPGHSNPGGDPADLHGVTIVGLVALVGMAVVALVAAVDEAVHGP